MRISTTERQTFLRCRRKWDFQSYNRQSLTPIINAPALDFGTIFHAALAEWAQNLDQDPEKIFREIAVQHLSDITKAYYEKVGCLPSKEELQPITDAIQMGKLMIQRYKERWNSPLPAGFTLIENEQTLIQDIPNTLNQLECTFDGIMANENGELFIIERKTFSRTPNLEEFQYNDQFIAYTWALNKKLPGRVAGLAYDGLLKNIKKPLDECFLRRVLTYTKSQLESWEEHLIDLSEEMANPNLRIYPTVPPVTGCQRWECQFIEMCHRMENKQPIQDLMKMYRKNEHKKHLETEQ